VNRDRHEVLTVTIDLSGFGAVAVLEALTLADEDLHAVNDLSNTERVGLAPNTTAAVAGGVLTIELPPVSWTAVSIGAAR
jgi:alpha-N-arabinofuranosidase